MSERLDVRIAVNETEHDWGRMPLRMRAAIALRVLLGRPFKVPGRMVVVAQNVRPEGT